MASREPAVRDLLDDLARWQAAGDRFALATVVETSSSAPLPPGSAVAVHPDGTVLGSVSGGCVEGAVVETCREVLAGAEPRTVRYGYSDADAFEVGLTCGGTIFVFIEAVEPDGDLDLAAIAGTVDAEEPVARATVVHGDRPLGGSLTVWPDRMSGGLGPEKLDRAVADAARGMLAVGESAQRRFGEDGTRLEDDLAVFVESFAPRPRMIVFGATDYATELAGIGRFLGFHVTVCDAREVFATAARFPEADEVVVDWPHRYLRATRVDARSVICVLTHDPKFDVPALLAAFETDAAFIGVMGSRTTHEDRLDRLRGAGATEEQLARLHSPVGLDLGGRTPAETAVSIAAEIVAERWGGSGRALRTTDGHIHA
jgi:xanthine dehydrogenase accessory factor